MAGVLDDVVSVDLVTKEWEALSQEFDHLEETYKSYSTTVGQFTKLQSKCMKELAHQRKRMGQLQQSLKTLDVKKDATDSHHQLVSELKDKIHQRKLALRDIEESLPRKNDLYLRIILDGINVSFINQEQRYKFKEQYEKFKIVVSALILLVALLDVMFHYRAIDAILHFLLVWYHCTLTIRESILVVNGSRIKGWWRAVQFIRTIKAGIFIVWPDGVLYDLFRTQFVMYTCYTTIIQFFQCHYQQGCLYRLRSLGERYDMDLTTDGFHSWMWKGLSFLLPFLYGAYAFQFYNGLTLYKLSLRPECEEWQVIVLSCIFLLLSAGNTFTTTLVVIQKLRGKMLANIRKHLRRIQSIHLQKKDDQVCQSNKKVA